MRIKFKNIKNIKNTKIKFSRHNHVIYLPKSKIKIIIIIHKIHSNNSRLINLVIMITRKLVKQSVNLQVSNIKTAFRILILIIKIYLDKALLEEIFLRHLTLKKSKTYRTLIYKQIIIRTDKSVENKYLPIVLCQNSMMIIIC